MKNDSLVSGSSSLICRVYAIDYYWIAFKNFTRVHVDIILSLFNIQNDKMKYSEFLNASLCTIQEQCIT